MPDCWEGAAKVTVREPGKTSLYVEALPLIQGAAARRSSRGAAARRSSRSPPLVMERANYKGWRLRRPLGGAPRSSSMRAGGGGRLAGGGEDRTGRKRTVGRGGWRRDAGRQGCEGRRRRRDGIGSGAGGRDGTGVRTGEVGWGGGLNRADSGTDAVFFEP
jgi:hypothetical protein